MKKLFMLGALLISAAGTLFAQKRGFEYRFYGQIRTDLFYNTRANSESVDGLFYMYPLDKKLDPAGNDLNKVADGNFYMLYSRVGIDVQGPGVFNAKTSAKMEVDFRGSGSSYSVLRMRHVYFNFDWGKSELLVGQTWHPLYGEVAPQILNLNMGAPYQPFSRAPQIRYRFTQNRFKLTAAALWQSQYQSVGPANLTPGSLKGKKSGEYMKKSMVPEFFLGMDYDSDNFMTGAGVHVSSIVPRVHSEMPTAEGGKQTYRVSERITGVSAEAHMKYSSPYWRVAAKTVLGTNLTQASGVGGYGITAIDEVTGEQKYTPLRTSSTWVNINYGMKWRPAIFLGYLKGLGVSKEVGGVIGTGTQLDQMVTASAELTYNLVNWKFGAEYSMCNVWYGDEFNEKHKATSSHRIANHRFVFVAMFQF